MRHPLLPALPLDGDTVTAVTAAPLTAGMSRAEKVATIRLALAAHPDMTQRQVAGLLGVRYRTLVNLLYDPDGEKQRARRARYRRPCAQCGRPLDGSSGWRGGLTCLCVACAAAARKRWTREAVLAAGREWVRVYGRPPTATDWRRRSRPGDPVEHPAQASVYGRRRGGSPFQAWSEFIAALGYQTPPGGYERTGTAGLSRQGREALRLLDTLDGGTVTRRQLAAALDITVHGARSTLHTLIRRGLIERADRGVYRKVA